MTQPSFNQPFGGFTGSDPFGAAGFDTRSSFDGTDFEHFDQSNPSAIISGLATDRGLTGKRRKRFQGLFGDILSQYQGFQANQARAGNQPQGNFTDFAQGVFGNRGIDDLFNELTPDELGLSTANLNPQTRFLR